MLQDQAMTRLIFCSLLGLIAALPAAAQPLDFTLIPEHSFVQFEVLHFGTSTSRGRFGPLSGLATLDRAARRGEVSLRVATSGVDTGLPVFDARLRQPDLLDSSGYPEAFFVSRNFVFEGDRLAEVRGEFTLRGRSRPLALKALRFGCRIDTEPRREVCGGDFEAVFKRSEYGANFGLPLVGNDVRLLIQVEAARAAP
jgi:polyisoprenoid-binding protein YceI